MPLFFFYSIKRHPVLYIHFFHAQKEMGTWMDLSLWQSNCYCCLFLQGWNIGIHTFPCFHIHPLQLERIDLKSGRSNCYWCYARKTLVFMLWDPFAVWDYNSSPCSTIFHTSCWEWRHALVTRMKSRYLEKIIGKKCRQSRLIAARIQDLVMYKIANDNVKTNMGMDKNSKNRK